MLIYKAVNKLNGKVYIGQTQGDLEKRKRQHLKKAHGGVKTHFYDAIRKYGDDAFEFSVVCEAKTKADLNLLETYYIQKYDSIKAGYNMVDGGDNNVMCIDSVYKKHKAKMQSEETRKKLSDTMKKKIADGKFFTEEHRKHLSESAIGNHNFGEKCYDTSIACYCVDEFGKEHHFHSYLDAGKWWFENYKPFPYSACVYQRKIKQSIDIGYCLYGRDRQKYEYPKWYREERDANEKVTDQN